MNVLQQEKVHEKLTIHHSIVFDTFGLLASKAMELLVRLQKIINTIAVSAGLMNVFTPIGSVIQKGIPTQLVR